MSMGESVMLHDAWRLLKDFSFRRNLPEDYYNTLADRMVRQIEQRRPLEHVDANLPRDKAKHYNDQKALRYHEGQALPKEFNTRAAKKYKFTLEDIMHFMANDVASQHPELRQVMNTDLRAPDSKLPNRSPSMHFDAFQTSRPKGPNSVVTPHFDTNPKNGKLQLVTIGDGMQHDKSRQSIHAKPTTSPVPTDTHTNANIHESLPQRFDFREVSTPIGVMETAAPTEPKDPYAGFPPALAEQMRQQDADNENKGEPMDIAMRLLKRDLSEMTDYEIDRARFANDNPELQSEERTRAMDRMAEFGRQNVTPFDYGDEVEEAYDDIGDQDHSDYFGEDIDPNELYQYILENAGEEAAQNYVQQYKDARAKYGGNAATMGQLDNYGISNQGDANDFIESRERMTGDMRNIMPNDETVFDAFPYPEGVVYNNKLSPPFTTTPENESNFQMKYTGEPMDIALRLLKNFVLEPDNPEQAYFQSSMGYHPETGKVGYVPNTEVDPLNDVSINLAHPKQFMLRDRDGNPVDDGAGFDQFVQRVDKDLLHEHTHGAIDREIRQAYKDKILPSENVFSAHEVGAIAAQNPGEGFVNQRGADRVSESETKHHPSTRDWRAEQSPFADGRWSPQPAYSSNSEGGYE